MLLSPVLLLLLSRAAAALVPRPTNVTLSCHNLHVAVRWEYSEERPQTRFRVRLIGSEGRPDERETTDHQYDLSGLVWKSEESYMDLHYVTVAAIEGGNRSELESSKTFSFNDLKTVAIKCELDFPPVDVDAKDSGATVSFNNPVHYYSRLQHAAKPGAAFKFTIKVSSSVAHFEGVCKKEQEKCKLDISFPEGGEKCVRLDGHLFDQNGVSSVLFRQTGDICAAQSTELSMTIVLAVLLSVLFAVIALVIILICKVRAWTMKSPGLPSSLMDFKTNPRDGEYDPVSRTDYSPLTVVSAEPCKNASVSSEDGDSLTEDRLTEDSCCCSEGELGDGYGGDLEEEEEEQQSPYDRQHNLPHNLQVDMGDGDMATGYS